MLTPTIHLNGTSGEELLRQVDAAATALLDALQRLADARPNGRDYYPQGAEAFGQALREHDARLERVCAVVGEYEQLAEAIQEQLDARRAR